MGSRNSNTTIYWNDKDNIQIVCGCFRGDIEKFEKKVNDNYPEGFEHGDNYRKQIEIFKYLVNQ